VTRLVVGSRFAAENTNPCCLSSGMNYVKGKLKPR
jgi:hypothetical protein